MASLLRGLARRRLASTLPRTPRRHTSSSSTPPPSATSSPKRPLAAESTPAKEAPPPASPPVPAEAALAVPPATAVTPPPFWQRLGSLTAAGRAYARAQRRRPWATQIASSLVIYLCADLSAQRIGGRRGSSSHDYARTARSLAIGGAAAVPGYLWFTWLSGRFNYARSRALSVAAKVAVNQAVFTPCFSVYFFGAQALLAGESLAETWDRVRRTVPVSLLNSVKLWPAVTAISFAFVPLEYRSVFAGCVAVGWQTYLSFLNRQAEVEERGERRAAAVRSSSAATTTTATTTTAAAAAATATAVDSPPVPLARTAGVDSTQRLGV
ncbi:hypothetical protein GGR56DRAFT_664736 [Xylariaceae sp. FL0804]|nr:hypothetical protein GGR56DRAFT_664736 [Xylariaceae sp. FL0804]